MLKTSKSPLRAFLGGPAGANLAGFEQVRGFVCAVAGAPELVPPSEWLPEALDGEPEFEDAEQAQAVLEELMGLYNSAVAGGRRTRTLAPAFRKETLANLDEDAAVARWSQGFIRGYSWLQGVWDELVPKELEEELASILLVLSFFSSRKMAEACRDETGGGKPLDEIAEIMRRTFAGAMEEYVRLGQTIYRVRLEYERTPEAAWEKVGRNEPCPCGSGTKYKKCCGGN